MRGCSINGCLIQRRARGWCWSHYQRWYKYGNPLASKPRTTLEKQVASFWQRVVKGDGCWLWQGSTSEDGYGLLNFVGVAEHKAHRFAWLLTNGEVPAGLCVCHSCDNPPCCNPGHLFLGTIEDNNRDRALKGRSAKEVPSRRKR